MASVPEIVDAAAAGAVIGSFLNVVAHRVPRGESLVSPGSRCPACGAPVKAYDNIPVVSWLLLRGRCRHCGEPIPIRYPLIEAALGISFGAIYLALRDQGTGEVVLGCTFAALLAVITLTDLERRIIPNAVVGAGTIAGIALVAIVDSGMLPEHLIAGAGAGGFLLIVALVYPRGMGMGDVKLAGMMGVYLGSAVIPALLIGFLSGSIFGLGLIAKHGSEARRSRVPFGPFLALGGVIAVLVGPEIVDWYTGTFFDA
jgi:leader peptidase (prepilin peptidase)/N-methyltransferase